MSATIPNLTRAAKVYWRTTWTDDTGKRHYKSFGRERTAARNRFSRWLVSWRNDTRVRSPNGGGPVTIVEAWKMYREHADAYDRRRDGSPADALHERHAAKRAADAPPVGGYDYRQMPPYQGRSGRARGRSDVKPGWTVNSYRRAIGRAAKLAGIPHWHPHQLRHTAASQVRAKWGLDGSQLLLGHRHAEVTEVYAEADMGRMKEMILQRG
jgi:integrase